MDGDADIDGAAGRTRQRDVLDSDDDDEASDVDPAPATSFSEHHLKAIRTVRFRTSSAGECADNDDDRDDLCSPVFSGVIPQAKCRKLSWRGCLCCGGSFCKNRQ